MRTLGKILRLNSRMTIGFMLFMMIVVTVFPVYFMVIEIPVIIISRWVSYIFRIKKGW